MTKTLSKHLIGQSRVYLRVLSILARALKPINIGCSLNLRLGTKKRIVQEVSNYPQLFH